MSVNKVVSVENQPGGDERRGCFNALSAPDGANLKRNNYTFTVSQVNRYAKHLLEDDVLLSGIFVTGELSNIHAHSSGHIYFTLKDEGAAVQGVMFKTYTRSMAFVPENGMKAVVFGRLSLYEKTGQYQLYAELIEPAGLGGLQAAFIKLRDTLRAEGLFDESRKKPLPAFVSCVALVTSPTGAAVRDMIRVIRERNPAVKIMVVPALVQGSGAAEDIARALREINDRAGADVIILGRGGGSSEDLQAFNEEVTARAVAASKIPVISAVGHETDFTICDFAADLRASTPTAGAAAAVFDLYDFAGHVKFLTEELSKSAMRAFDEKVRAYQSLLRSAGLRDPLRPVYETQTHVLNFMKNLFTAASNQLNIKKTALALKASALEKNSPYAAWKRGYALVRDENGAVVSDGAKIKPGMNVTLTWEKMSAVAEITGYGQNKYRF